MTFCFTLLDENDAAPSTDENYIICIFRAPESYECMLVRLKDVIKDVELI